MTWRRSVFTAAIIADSFSSDPIFSLFLSPDFDSTRFSSSALSSGSAASNVEKLQNGIRFLENQLLISVGSLEFSGGRAEISEVSRCVGDAYLVTVRNKKLVGYTYELSLKVKGEWTVKDEQKILMGHIDVAEFSFGVLDDLQIEAKLTDVGDLPNQDKVRINQDLKSFLKPVREKLIKFEQELKTK
ncbi:hypothetical protein QQ045_016072 [Rhodiola kirilowii]